MGQIKVGFVLLSNSRNPIPSTRIAVLNMFPLLRAHGIEPHIVFEPPEGTETPEVAAILPQIVAGGFKVVVFQKVHGASVEALAVALRAAGIKTIFAVCDVTDVAMARATDRTVVVTDFLKSLYPPELRDKIRVVHDGIEHPDLYKRERNGGRGSAARPLRAVLVTSVHLTCLPVLRSVPSWLHVTIVGRYASTWLERLRQAKRSFFGLHTAAERLAFLGFLANPRIRCVPWHPVEVYARMLDADIGIIPIDTVPVHAPGSSPPSWKVKSENRLTMKMSLGLPVIATAIPSYEPVIDNGRNGFLARTAGEWTACLAALRDPALRESVGTAARATALTRYSMQEQARLLVEAIGELVSVDKVATPPV